MRSVITGPITAYRIRRFLKQRWPRKADIDRVLSFTPLLEEVEARTRYQHSLIHQRLNLFANAFDLTFPFRVGKKSLTRRAIGSVLTWMFLQEPLRLYALGFNGPAIVDLYALLERFLTTQATNDATGLKEDPKRNTAYSKLFANPSVDHVKLLSDLGLLSKDNAKFIERFTRLRNGIAHKNAQKVSNSLTSGKKIRMFEIERVLSRTDIIPYFIGTMNIIIAIYFTGRLKHKF
jgi:hypothetical protein